MVVDCYGEGADAGTALELEDVSVGVELPREEGALGLGRGTGVGVVEEGGGRSEEGVGLGQSQELSQVPFQLHLALEVVTYKRCDAMDQHFAVVIDSLHNRLHL